MKTWVWSALVFIVTLIIALIFNIPFWLFILIVIPLLIIAFTYGSFNYSFRSTLKAVNIPSKGYSSRIKELDIDAKKVDNLGFEKWDDFYLKMIPDSIVYVFKNKEEPVYLCLYNFGSKKTCDLFTRYENDYTLTTCNTVDGGMTPRSQKSLLQIVTNVSYENLFEIHKKAHEFLKNKGLRKFDIAKQEFRQYFLKSIHEYAQFVRKYPFWPVLLIFWTVIKRGRVYCKKIETQYNNGTVQLHNT
jgi:hypothetical protein